MSSRSIRRGELWMANLSPTRGHEQAGRRPVLVLSVDPYNDGPSELVVVLAVTTTIRAIPTCIVVQPPEGGVRASSAILCDQVRTISRDRIDNRLGVLRQATMRRVEEAARIILGL